MRIFTVLALLSACASYAAADVVVLKDGSRREGKVLSQDEKVVRLEVSVGTIKGVISIKRSEVASIERGQTDNEKMMAAFKKKRKALEADDVDGRLKLARWCRQQKGMSSKARELHREVLKLESDNQEARKALGYVRSGGTWKTLEEVMLEEGKVRFEGKWMTPAQKAGLLAGRSRRKVRMMNHQEVQALAKAEEERRFEEARARTRLTRKVEPRQPLEPFTYQRTGVIPVTVLRYALRSGTYSNYPYRRYVAPSPGFVYRNRNLNFGFGSNRFGYAWNLSGRSGSSTWSLGSGGFTGSFTIK